MCVIHVEAMDNGSINNTHKLKCAQTHSNKHTTPHVHTATHTHNEFYILPSITSSGEIKMKGLWNKWCFPVAFASPSYQAASNEMRRGTESIGHVSAQPCDIKHINKTLEQTGTDGMERNGATCLWRAVVVFPSTTTFMLLLLLCFVLFVCASQC